MGYGIESSVFSCVSTLIGRDISCIGVDFFLSYSYSLEELDLRPVSAFGVGVHTTHICRPCSCSLAMEFFVRSKVGQYVYSASFLLNLQKQLPLRSL